MFLLVYHIVLCKKVFHFGHGFEFQVVAGRILEEHGVLFTWLPLESEGWLYYEFDTTFFQSLRQFMKLFHG